MKRRYYFACIRRGLIDGWDSPHFLGMGMTWDENDNDGRINKNELYDRCVNIGQFLRSPFKHERVR